ncbi:uncharacterized protein BX664DRAFT_333408 [Halteromyces radiatus]|uniref:uncharacterized protein n=1 Tax=Halteromyces radiatus TaxID=101107 RepID=UPI00221E91EE|nr:uncharacterized protein BX664DRAFT_333408 [Halteromyces radiatus]KAI8089588.1 hypothetical protein BX664DRAFT_333408 [Halteromyces radiatus]
MQHMNTFFFIIIHLPFYSSSDLYHFYTTTHSSFASPLPFSYTSEIFLHIHMLVVKFVSLLGHIVYCS